MLVDYLVMLRRPIQRIPLCCKYDIKALHNRAYLPESQYIRSIQEQNDGEGGINAFVSTNFRIEDTGVDGPLSGSCIAVKDNICTADLPTTCSSSFLRDFNPGYDATVVKLLRKSGAHVVGKTNCDEFGMGSFNNNSIHGAVINPFQPGGARSRPHEVRELRSSGGSSGGSAAAVAASMCASALGTDTGGSIRLPASYCGVAGFKPSYGLVSRWGVISYADSLDCVGVFAKSVDELHQVFDVINAYDAKDPTSAPDEVREKANKGMKFPKMTGGDLEGIKIGIPQECFPSELASSSLAVFRNVLVQLRERGAHLVPVSVPTIPYSLSAYYVIASAEASSNLARYDGVRFGDFIQPPPHANLSKTSNVYAFSRSSGFGSEVKKRILLGTYALTASAFDNYFLKAQQIRSTLKTDFDNVFKQPNVLSRPQSVKVLDESQKVDFLLHLSAIGTAVPLDHRPTGVDGYVQDVLTVPASLAGLPALNVPAGIGNDGWPVGISILGQWGSDNAILSFGKLIDSLQL